MQLRRAMTTIMLALVGACAASGQIEAQVVADFYRGRHLEIIVGASAGGGYDANARLLSRHFGRFIPGNPVVIVSNLPSAGGITAANTLFNVSARDGSVLATFTNAMLTLPLLGGAGARFDPFNFTWIGSIAREDGVCITTKSSGVSSWSDLLQKEVIAGASSPGTTTYLYPTVLRGLFGAKFRIVSGYPDSSRIILSLERGEVDAICQTFSSLNILHPEWFAKRTVNSILAMGLMRNRVLPDVPTVLEIARNEDERVMLKVVLAPTLAGRPFAAPPGIPAERAEALRAAFLATMRDPAFLEDAARSRIEVDPTPGPEINALLREIYAVPTETISRLKALAGIEAGK